jgi:CelD/BcsL family acetyltransferase involved in cellulose biosynthesis
LPTGGGALDQQYFEFALTADTHMAPADEVVVTRVIANDGEWDAIRDDWDALYAVSPTASTPLDFAWLRGWWRAYQPTLRDSSPQVVTVWRANRLIGAAPLYVRTGTWNSLRLRRLGFISTGEAEYEESCPDYLDILCGPGHEATAAAAIWQAIERMSWDHLELIDLPENTPLLRLGVVPPHARSFSRGQCPIADLADGFDGYLECLSANTRQRARRLLRAAERHKAAFELATEENRQEFFEDLVRLHQDRWTAQGKAGSFAAPTFTEFHRRLVGEWLPNGRAVLARLSRENVVYAVLYGFVTGKKFDFYQSGVTRGDTSPIDSPGTTAHLLLMRELGARGITAYDFLRGSSSYKERLATTEASLVGVRIWRPSLRTAIYRSAQLAQRAVRKVTLLARRRRQ